MVDNSNERLKTIDLVWLCYFYYSLVLFPYVPIGHGVGAADPSGQKDPNGQSIFSSAPIGQ